MEDMYVDLQAAMYLIAWRHESTLTDVPKKKKNIFIEISLTCRSKNGVYGGRTSYI